MPQQVFAASGTAFRSTKNQPKLMELAESSNDIKVSAKAPKGILPDGTTIKVKEVTGADLEAVKAAVEKRLDNTVTKIQAVDISFWSEGKEIQPNGLVDVQIESKEIAGFSNPVLIHMPDEAKDSPEIVKDIKVDADKSSLSFNAKAFSVYVIVETGEDARLKVNFVLADGTTKTQMITKRQLEHIDQYIFDPGANQPEGTIFKGWTTVENYDSSTAAKTIADVRNDVKAKLEEGSIHDGDSLTYYAMIFN